ncbi:MAG: exopolysaccharide biosynthesis protein, partial [Xanthobacteraceae bacterium]|nr:exopolysaccharide biosynthesis protein [Xanthobacteraceae bacterium]
TEDVHTSTVLGAIIDEAPLKGFTLEWLINNLPHRSFGAIMLLLAIVAMVPVVSIAAGLLIAILAVQIVMGYKTPVFPQRLMKRPLPTRYLLPLEHYAIPLLTRLETAVRPRWPALVRASSRLTGVVILLLTFVLLTFPFPLSNIPPAAIIALIALAESERDGLLLTAALTLGAVLLVLVFAAVLGLIDGAEWILRFL